MAENTIKLPFKIEIPKPRSWDFAAFAAAIAAAVVAAINLRAVQGDAGSISGGATLFFGLAQLAISSIGLLLLGKTAKYGSIWGNLAAVGAMMAGVGGVLLAAALWTAA